MGLRSRLRALSSSKPKHDSASQPPLIPSQPQIFGPLPPNLAEPIILNINDTGAQVMILTQATDSTPLFQIDISLKTLVTHIPTSTPIGSISFGASNSLTLSHPSTSTVLTYRDDLTPPPWFTSLHGNALYWSIPACNEYQATLRCEIVDGIDHLTDDLDVLIEIILDSKFSKGRIEFKKVMGKEEMDFLLLSALAEIDDLKGKVQAELKQVEAQMVAAGQGGRRGYGMKPSAGQYLQLAGTLGHLGHQIGVAQGYAAGDSGGGYVGDSGGGGGGGGDGGGGGGGGDGGGGGGGF